MTKVLGFPGGTTAESEIGVLFPNDRATANGRTRWKIDGIGGILCL